MSKSHLPGKTTASTEPPFRKAPLALALSQHRTVLLATALLLPVPALGAEDGLVIEEIIVTAQKRTSTLQDTPISLQVLGNERMEQLGIKDFADYIQYLPTVTYDSSAPGTAQVFMRGISSGNNGNHSASMPSVGVYLDEQPITTINEILDIHAYDIARIETLAGPQGTLFGTSSQSGTLRIITNKPVIGEFEGSYAISGSTMSEGDEGYTAEGFVNIPMGEKAAVRLVGWHDKRGGYIDNVPDSITFAASGITIDNNNLVEDDFNEVTTSGLRAMLKVDLNENWTITPGYIYQEREADGLFSHDPEDLGELEARAFYETTFDEEWYQATLTVEGNIGGFDLVYAGSYMERDRDSLYDYTGYAEYLENLYAYYGYTCVYYQAGGACADPSQFVGGDENWNRYSHELRLQTPQDKRVRAIVGVFYQDQEHDFDLQWIVPDMNSTDSVIQGGKTTWQTFQIRQDQDDAIFGEVSWDVTDRLTVMGGFRSYSYENKLFGFNGFIGHCTGSYINGEFVEDRVNGTPQYPCFDTKILDGEKDNDDTIYKVNASFEINDNVMIYATYSEGYRAGGVNRARVPGIPGYEEDFTENYELGWKTTLWDGRIRFNGAVYQIDWDDFQYSILDFTVSNLTIINNAGTAEVLGFEFDSEILLTDEFSLSIAGSYNDSELTEDLINGITLEASDGQDLPFSPKYQWNVIGRYETDIGEFGVHAQAAYSYTSHSWSDLRFDARLKQHQYELLNLNAGITKNNWSLDLFVHNATDERAEISRGDPGYPSSIDTTTNVNRPRIVSLRFSQRF